MNYSIIIPARFNSGRLPGKVLCDIGGKPMLQHAYERALRTKADKVIIAADDEKVRKVALGFGAEVCLTGQHHQSGSERLAEVVTKYQMADEAVVVNLQADEPFIAPALLDQVAEMLLQNSVSDMATLARPLVKKEELFDPNFVKVVCDKNDHALYFSRATIPWHVEAFRQSQILIPKDFNYRVHLGIYAYKVSSIRFFYETCVMSPLEQLEKLEQLRVLWHGGKILVDNSCVEAPFEINTPHDLARAREYYASSPAFG